MERPDTSWAEVSLDHADGGMQADVVLSKAALSLADTYGQRHLDNSLTVLLTRMNGTLEKEERVFAYPYPETIRATFAVGEAASDARISLQVLLGPQVIAHASKEPPARPDRTGS